MRGIFKIITVLVVILAFFVLSFVGFWVTGGSSLVGMYRNYLKKDLPNKVYSADNFRDHGPREMMHGYYAGSRGDTFYIWTLSGLKKLVHRNVTSVYYYVDPCGLIKKIEAGERSRDEGGTQADLGEYFELTAWAANMKPGYYVWVKRVGEGADRNIVDKAWGSSNMTYPVEAMSEGSCKK